ncbi:Protein of unknown function [Bacillus mycoides]|nr:Protein of unknown function [Bacillus mycoides]
MSKKTNDTPSLQESE